MGREYARIFNNKKNKKKFLKFYWNLGGSRAFVSDEAVPNAKEITMLHWAFTFLVLALIAGFLGFGGVAAVSIQIAQMLCFLFLILFVLAAVAHALRGRFPPS